jgi:hypothetical protein
VQSFGEARSLLHPMALSALSMEIRMGGHLLPPVRNGRDHSRQPIQGGGVFSLSSVHDLAGDLGLCRKVRPPSPWKKGQHNRSAKVRPSSRSCRGFPGAFGSSFSRIDEVVCNP